MNCRSCDIELTAENSYLSNHINWIHLCKDCSKKFARERHRQLRQLVIATYGGKCTCPCGCNQSQWEYLGIDHKDGGGNQHRRQIGAPRKFLQWIVKNSYPKTLRLLCHNCHYAITFYGYCPREKPIME